jgi:hypothetical protein
MPLRPRVRALVFAAAIAAVGCNHAPRANFAEQANPKLAYLYGRFFVKAEVKPNRVGPYPTLGLVIGCLHEAEYTIRFINQRDIVQIVPVSPSRCRIVRMFRTDEHGFTREGGVIDPAATTFQDFEAGGAYYLGDYFARAGIDYTYRNDRLKRFRAWDMSPADGRYESTTADMKRQYPGLAKLPTENAPFVPPPPPVKRGDVIIDDPSEPAMTPDRIARVAPFVQRTYASPAQCEAACATGQCLPFRTDRGGAAMTCINRCNSDADCPAGYACNCPGGTPTDCPVRAEQSKDKLAKICLPAAAPRPDAGAHD